RAHRQRNDIAGVRGALLPALAKPSKRRVDEQCAAVDVLDQQAVLTLEVGLEAAFQRIGALPRLHIPGGLKRTRPGFAELHDGARKRVPRRRGGEVIGDEVSAHGRLAISGGLRAGAVPSDARDVGGENVARTCLDSTALVEWMFLLCSGRRGATQ